MNCSACIPSPNCCGCFPIFPRRRARPSCWTRCAPGSRRETLSGLASGRRRSRLAPDGGRGLRALPADVLRQPASGLVGVRAGRPGRFPVRERAFRRGLARIPVARRRGPLPGFACLPRGAGRDAAGGDGRAAGRLAGSGPGLRQRQSLAGAAPRQGAAAHRPGLRTGGRLAGGGTGVRAMRLSGRAPPPHPRARTHDIAARGAGAGGTGPGRA